MNQEEERRIIIETYGLGEVVLTKHIFVLDVGNMREQGLSFFPDVPLSQVRGFKVVAEATEEN